MARIELRNTTILMKDGFGNGIHSPVVLGNQSMGETTVEIQQFPAKVPVGARMNITGNSQTYVVTARTLSPGVDEQQTVGIDNASSGGSFTLTFDGFTTAAIDYDASASEVEDALELLDSIGTGNVAVTGGPGPNTDWVVTFQGDLADANQPAMTGNGSLLTGGSTTVTITETTKGRAVDETTAVTVSPALTAMVSSGAAIEFEPQQIEIKIGEGDLTYTETDQYTYDLDRGELDTVRRGDDVPMEVSLAFTFEHVTTGTNEAISPVDALKRINGASEWVTSSDDPCEPYAVDIEVIHEPPCGTSQIEVIVFPDFRAESRQFSFRDAQISVTGRCNATEPIVTRV
jgi:hypothetical protein